MRRITRLLLTAALGAGSLVLTAGPAGAVGESVEGCTIEGVGELIEEGEIAAAVLAYEEAKEAGEIEKGTEAYDDAFHEVEEIVADCIEAPNVLLPEINEVIWGGVGFVVVLFFIMKFGFPAIKKGMADRSDKIAADLKAAEDAKAEAEAEKARYSASLADAKSEAARIIEEARQQADGLKTEAQGRLNDELAQARASAQADIDAAKAAAMNELRGEVATIAIGAAEQVVGSNLDQAAQTRLVEDYISNLQNGN